MKYCIICWNDNFIYCAVLSLVSRLQLFSSFRSIAVTALELDPLPKYKCEAPIMGVWGRAPGQRTGGEAP